MLCSVLNVIFLNQVMGRDSEKKFQFDMHKIKQRLEYYDVKIYDQCFFKNYLLKENDVSKCLLKIDSFFALKKLYPEYLLPGDMEDSDFNSFCKSIYSCYLPELNSDGCRIFIDKITADEKLFDVFKIIKYYCMQTEIRLLEGEPDNGDVILFDCNRINYFHFIAFVPYFMKSLQIISMVYPLQIHSLVLINVGKMMEILINGLKLLAPRYRTMIFAYSEGSEHFSKHVALNILPKEYGGPASTLDEVRAKWFQKLSQHQTWFRKAKNEIIKLEYYKLENIHLPFGANGTFRALQLD